ncbi:MAG: hypothetical protein SVM86_01050 [Candidatus Cloacimonadota bacterium]|nr:hypothetical protein [Candidatus Cloacimonadota bacterium]
MNKILLFSLIPMLLAQVIIMFTIKPISFTNFFYQVVSPALIPRW